MSKLNFVHAFSAYANSQNRCMLHEDGNVAPFPLHSTPLYSTLLYSTAGVQGDAPVERKARGGEGAAPGGPGDRQPRPAPRARAGVPDEEGAARRRMVKYMLGFPPEHLSNGWFHDVWSKLVLDFFLNLLGLEKAAWKVELVLKTVALVPGNLRFG